MATLVPAEGLHGPPENAIHNLSTMDVDVDSDMEEIPVVLPIASGFAPKTMREMAESAAKRREEATDASGDVEIIGTDIQQHPAPSTEGKSEKSTLKMKVTRPSRANSSTAVLKKGDAHPRPTRRVSARKRERDSETDEDIISDGSGNLNLSSPKKRTRVVASSSTHAPSARTLRPRASKTPAQIQEEKEQEAAFRRATAS
jgi:xeroderma pigmentosum group C-complementing protein